MKWVPELGKLVMLDSYNHKLRTVDPVTGSVERLLGSSPDFSDEFNHLNEPTCAVYYKKFLYITDSNNHALRLLTPSPV